MRPIDRVSTWFSKQDKDDWWAGVLVLAFLVVISVVFPLMHAG